MFVHILQVAICPSVPFPLEAVVTLAKQNVNNKVCVRDCMCTRGHAAKKQQRPPTQMTRQRVIVVLLERATRPRPPDACKLVCELTVMVGVIQAC